MKIPLNKFKDDKSLILEEDVDPEDLDIDGDGVVNTALSLGGKIVNKE